MMSIKWLCTCAVIGLLAVESALGQTCDPSLHFRNDPVELMRGKEVDGQEAIYAVHFRYRYQFAREENKAEFLKNPTKYEIQLLIAQLKARNEPQTIITHQGSAEVEREGKKVAVEKVAVASRGSTITLSINPATGEIVSTSYRAAGPRLSLGTIERVFSNYGANGGLILPMSAAVTFDGKPVEDSPVHLKYIRLDEPVEPSFFEAPSSK